MSRITNDAYQTPQWCVDALLPHLDLETRPFTFLEPCRGKGVIFDAFRPRAAMTNWCEIDGALHGESRDYLSTCVSPVDLIVTNPPFSRAEVFLRLSLLQASTVIYLMRMSMLGSSGRKDFWDQHPPTHLFPLTPRPIFVWVCETDSCKAKYEPGTTTCELCHSKVKPQSDNSEYAWFCWDSAGRVKADNWLTVLGKAA